MVLCPACPPHACTVDLDVDGDGDALMMLIAKDARANTPSGAVQRRGTKINVDRPPFKFPPRSRGGRWVPKIIWPCWQASSALPTVAEVSEGDERLQGANACSVATSPVSRRSCSSMIDIRPAGC